jgi:predicted molibdopterin-dependent oxidoreductase YjgC
VLFTYPLLVDEGRLSIGADKLKEALEEPAFVEVHSSDASRLGLADGVEARVRTEAGVAALRVRITDHIAPGVVFMPWNQPGLAANTLLSGSSITAVTIEPVAVGVPA